MKRDLLYIKELIIKKVHNHINYNNRKRLINLNPTIICSDCAGGIISQWLGLKFNSPFVNLYMTNNDFISALENFDTFIENEITEDKNNDKPYPVGIGCNGEKIHFMHYQDFTSAIEKWNERKKRIDKNNMGIIFSNLDVKQNNADLIEIINRFNKLSFKNKIILSGESYKVSGTNIYFIKGYNHDKCVNVCFHDSFGKRYIDQFDYISFINSFTK